MENKSCRDCAHDFWNTLLHDNGCAKGNNEARFTGKGCEFFVQYVEQGGDTVKELCGVTKTECTRCCPGPCDSRRYRESV